MAGPTKKMMKSDIRQLKETGEQRYDRARARSADKRGGGAARVDLAPGQLVDWNQPSKKLQSLDEALSMALDALG